MLKFLLVRRASGGPLRFIGIIHEHLSKDTGLKGFSGSYTWVALTLHGSSIADVSSSRSIRLKSSNPRRFQPVSVRMPRWMLLKRPTCDAAEAAGLSELELMLKEEQRAEVKGFLSGKDVFASLLTGFATMLAKVCRTSRLAMRQFSIWCRSLCQSEASSCFHLAQLAIKKI